MHFIRKLTLFSIFVSLFMGAPTLKADWLWGNSQDQDGLNAATQTVSCQGFDKSEVVIDGVRTFRFVVNDPKYLKCLPEFPKAVWKVSKDRWSQVDEQNWQEFVRSIGKAVENGACNSLDTCLASKANAYRSQMDIDGFHYADCADLPLYLRGYFAFKNKLPFSMVAEFGANELNLDQIDAVEKRRQVERARGQEDAYNKTLADLRYSLNGNFAKARLSVPPRKGVDRDFYSMARYIHDRISSGSYRMYKGDGSAPVLPDFYSPKIDKESIRAGTVIYNPSGHVSLVYEVTQDGEILSFDAHPDNSISRKTFNKENLRSTPLQGANFKNWRPFKLVDVQWDKNGYVQYARSEHLQDLEIADFSEEQYYGVNPSLTGNWKEGQFVVNGRNLTFHEYVRIKMANGIYKQNPLFQFRKDLNAICTDLQTRADAVQLAINNQIHLKEHPLNLPTNIYGASGEWESYSTPGRDLRVRQRTTDLVDSTKEYMKKWYSNDLYFDYKGQNLKKDLLKIYHEVDANCRVMYKNSDNLEIKMSLGSALNRMSVFSFDPYMCPEVRWGAQFQHEMNSCRDDSIKKEWQDQTQFLRNQVVRDPTEVMGYSLDDVRRMNQMMNLNQSIDSRRFHILEQLKAL